MNLNVYIICVAAVVLLAVPAAADSTATIHGEVYGWDTFEPLENAVVEVNSTPSQSMVAKYGVYSFELEPGDYIITASYYQNSTLIYSAEEPIKIKGEGSYVLDLLLLPIYSEELMEDYEVKDSSENTEDTENSSTTTQTVSEKSDDNSSDINNSRAGNVSTIGTGVNGAVQYYVLAALALSLLLAGGYKFQKDRNIEKKKLEIDKLEKSRLEINKLGKERLLKEKAELETEKLSVPLNTLDFSTKAPDEGIEPKTEQELPLKPIEKSVETQLSEEPEGKSDFEVQEERKKAESKELHHIHETETPETEPADLEKEVGESKETSPVEPVQVPDPTKVPEPAPAVKKNLPLPADLQEVMDIIRGQGGRITQKDLRSKIKYSEGKVSLMLADLERRELIEKFKRGRGNVVILRDEERKR